MTVDTADRVVATKRLGTDISVATSVQEALVLADLDWTIREVQPDDVSITTDTEVIKTSIPGRRMFLRSDNHVTLNVGGSRYRPVDNASAFAAADVAVALGARFDSAGQRNHGRQTFMSLALPDATVEVGGLDLVRFDLLLTANHGGDGRVTCQARATRLTCTNGQTMKLQVPRDWGVSHTASADQQLAEAKEWIRGTMRYAREFAAVADHLIDTPMTVAEFKAFIDALFPRPDDDSKRALGIWSRRRTELLDLFRFADTNELGRGTRWAGLAALTEGLDWGGSTHDNSVRAARQLTGTYQSIKDVGLEMLARV